MIYKVGQKVNHVKFGEGVVIECRGIDDKASVTVHFKEAGIKQLMLAYAKLDAIDAPLTKQKEAAPLPKIEADNLPMTPKKSAKIIKFPERNSRRIKPEITLQDTDTAKAITSNAGIKTGDITQSGTGNTINLKQENHNYKGKGKAKYPSLPRLLPEQGGLTDEHRATLDKLVNKAALLEKIAFNRESHGKVRKNLAIKITGSNSYNRIPESDFLLAERILKQDIARLNNHWFVIQNRTLKLDEAHKRLKALGVSEETRRAYQLFQYGYDSMAYFDVEELADYCKFLNQENPDFNSYETHQELEEPKNPKLNTQQKREAILEQWLTEKEKSDPTFDRWLMPYSTDDIYRILRTIDKLFMVSDDTLRKFWNDKKNCDLKKGCKPNK